MRIVTWNVLHRVHAVNWDEAPVAAYPDERVRIERIATTVAAWLADDVDVVCLQEVSGDQLAALRAHVTSSVAVLDHRLARIPRLRKEGAALSAPAEHLVALVRDGASARVREGHTFASDAGKGMLAVEVGSALVVCTHVSYGERSPEQLARVAAAGADIVVGDFNAPADVVSLALGGDYTLAKIEEPTRVVPGGASKVIDHVLVRGGGITSAVVLATGDLSDHRPVAVAIRNS